MKRFFALTFRPFFVVTGAITALGSLNAFWPRWTAEAVERIVFIREYTIILQHWGIMLGLTGVFMIIAAYRAEWRIPILLFSAFEKSFIVYLVVANRGSQYVNGFRLGAAMDATVVLYTIVYFAVHGFSAPLSQDSEQRGRIDRKRPHSPFHVSL